MYVCQVIRYSHHHTATVDKPGAQCTQCLATGRMGKLWQLSPTAFRESLLANVPDGRCSVSVLLTNQLDGQLALLLGS